MSSDPLMALHVVPAPQVSTSRPSAGCPYRELKPRQLIQLYSKCIWPLFQQCLHQEITELQMQLSQAYQRHHAHQRHHARWFCFIFIEISTHFIVCLIRFNFFTDLKWTCQRTVYTDVLCLDETRVKLSSTTDPPSDYINANFCWRL